MKIVFLDSSSLGSDCNLSGIETFGELITYENTAPEERAARVADAQMVLTNKVVMDKDTIDAAPQLKYIGVTATGTNNVDIPYAVSKGIVVTNVKGYSTPAVVQHTFALLLGVMEQTAYYDRYVKSGDYSRSGLFTCLDRPFHELSGKTYGIIGLGEIGRGVAKAAEAFGCRVICYSASGGTYPGEYEQVDFDTLLAESDILSVHAPLNSHTENLMDATAFSRMKKTAYFVNVGRGPIVNETALANALDEGQIAGAGIDVFSREPLDAANPLLNLKHSHRIFMTPHIAWAGIQSRERLVKELELNIEAFLSGEPRSTVG